MMQAFAFNIRRDKFKDPRVRRAFNFARFDFEEMNRQIFFGQYERIAELFRGHRACRDRVAEQELALLEPLRDKVPPEVFTTPYGNPVGGDQKAGLDNLRAGLRLLRQAGYEIRDQKLVDAKTGAPFTVELLADDPSAGGSTCSTSRDWNASAWRLDPLGR